MVVRVRTKKDEKVKIITVHFIINISSSHWRCSVKKVILKNFVNFKEKHLR